MDKRRRMVAFRLPPNLLDALHGLSLQEGLPVTWLVEAALYGVLCELKRGVPLDQISPTGPFRWHFRVRLYLKRHRLL